MESTYSQATTIVYRRRLFSVDEVRLLVSEKIKKSFDPKRILNPGKMYRGI